MLCTNKLGNYHLYVRYWWKSGDRGWTVYWMLLNLINYDIYYYVYAEEYEIIKV